MSEKPIIWLGRSHADLCAFPTPARREAGHQLSLVQLGRDPTDWRPMPQVGVGVREIRVHAAGAYRVMYMAQRPEAVYVLHAFEKRTATTRQADLDLARRRLRMIDLR